MSWQDGLEKDIKNLEGKNKNLKKQNKKMLEALKRYKDLVKEYQLDDDEELLIEMEIFIQKVEKEE